LDFLKGSSCPFCEQSLDGIDLIANYQSYFSKEYQLLKVAIANLKARIEELDSEAAILRLSQAMDRNEELTKFWLGFVDANGPTLDQSKVQGARSKLVIEAMNLAEAKLASPLEPMQPSDSFAIVNSGFGSAKQAVGDYNVRIGALSDRNIG